MYSDDNQYDSDDDFKLTPSLPSQVDQPKDDLPKIESNANATSAETEDTPVNSGCAIPVMTNRQCRLEYKDLDNCGCGDKACAHLIAARLSCNLPVNLPIELSMLKKSLTLALKHQFGEAALEWVNYIRYQKNAVQEKNIIKDGSGTKIDLYGAADEFFLSHISTMYTLQRRS
uniref:SWIM-type domain-containing protein n=1 Tax=Romanomermis culicivorax TaxID=13658 RepID=A0A915I3K4_ROMCU